MKNHFLTAVLLMGFSVVFAQNAKDETEVRKLNEQFDEAIKNADLAFYERVLAPEYVSLLPDGSIKNRDEVLEEVKAQKANPTYRITDIGSEDVNVKLSGNLAIVTAQWSSTSQSMEDDEPHNDSGRYIAVYEKQNDQWKLISDMGSEKPHTPEELEPSLRKASDQYDEAISKRDREALEELLADDFTSTNPEGEVRSKKEDIEMLLNPDMKLENASTEDKKFRVFRNFAVETGKYNFKGSYKDDEISESGRYTSTWIFKDGKWKMVADHVSSIPEE